MKKLMIAAAIVCAAAFAQASSVSWNYSTYFEDADSGDPATGSVELFFNGSSLGVFDIEEGTASGTVSIDNAGGTISAVATITNFSDGSGTADWSMTYDALPLAGDPNTEASLLKINNSIYAAFTNDGNLLLGEGAAANGYTPAPEPTSGLLLLLGVAGLALRRRRA